jgi:hypothetical protein
MHAFDRCAGVRRRMTLATGCVTEVCACEMPSGVVAAVRVGAGAKAIGTGGSTFGGRRSILRDWVRRLGEQPGCNRCAAFSSASALSSIAVSGA